MDEWASGQAGFGALIQSAYAALLEMGFSKRTVEKTHAVLHRALGQAMHWGLTAFSPTELVSPARLQPT